MDEWRIGKALERSGHDLIEVLSQLNGLYANLQIELLVKPIMYHTWISDFVRKHILKLQAQLFMPL